MNQSPREDSFRAGGEVVDFDEALLDACPADELAELMREAELLAQAFAPEGRAAQIRAVAGELQSGVRHLERGRRHAVHLAAALRRLAREAEG
jgi:hypothetical protein